MLTGLGQGSHFFRGLSAGSQGVSFWVTPCEAGCLPFGVPVTFRTVEPC